MKRRGEDKRLTARNKRRLSTRQLLQKKLKEVARRFLVCSPSCLCFTQQKKKKRLGLQVQDLEEGEEGKKGRRMSCDKIGGAETSTTTTATGSSTSSSTQLSLKKQQQTQKNKNGGSEEERRLKEVEGHVLDNYKIIKRVGKGAYGIVWEAEEKREGRRRVALKKIFDAFRNGTDAQRTFREVTFLRALEPHPLIVNLLKIHPSNNGLDLYLVFPFVPTDLHKVIKTKPELLRDNKLRRIVYEILVATNYLHSAQIIHRDLKPANILLDEKLNVQLADFGLARTLHEESPDSAMEFPNAEMTDYVATRWYRPPEILLSAKKYTKGVDMWSIGCILGEMILKEPLFPGENTNEQIELILQTILPPTQEEIDDFCRGTKGNVSGAIIEACLEGKKGESLEAMFCDHDLATVDLMERLLIFSPGRRLSAVQALAHPYFEQVRDLSLEFLCHKKIQPFFDDNARLNLEEYRRVLFDPDTYFPQRIEVEDQQHQNEKFDESDEVDKFFREEQHRWQEQRRWIPRPPTGLRDIEDANNIVGDQMSSALDAAESAVQRTITGSRQSKSILTLPRPIPPPPALSLPSDNLLRGGKPPAAPTMEIDLTNSNLNNNSLVLSTKANSSSSSRSRGGLDNVSRYSGDSSYSKTSSFRTYKSTAAAETSVDEGGDRGILEKFHELCLKYNFDLPLEEGHGPSKDLLVEKKKIPPTPLPPGEGEGDFMRWPVVSPQQNQSNLSKLGTSNKTSSSSYITYTSSSSLNSNLTLNNSCLNKKEFNPYKPAGLKSGLSFSSTGSGDGCLDTDSRLLDLFPPTKGSGGSKLQQRFQEIDGLQRRAKLSASSTSAGTLPPLVSRSNLSAGSLRNKPPMGPPRTSAGGGLPAKSNLMMAEQQKKQQQQQQQQPPFQRPFGGITYNKKFTGPSFRRKGVSMGASEDSSESRRTAGRHSAYFPNAGLGHPLAPTGAKILKRHSSTGGGAGVTGISRNGSSGTATSLEHMIVGPPSQQPSPSSVVRASDLFELKNNIHRHHDPHRHRRQLR